MGCGGGGAGGETGLVRQVAENKGWRQMNMFFSFSKAAKSRGFQQQKQDPAKTVRLVAANKTCVRFKRGLKNV